MEIEIHSSVQFADVQSGHDRMSRSTNSDGILVGSDCACETLDLNKSILSLDDTSANTLSTPLMRDADNTKLNLVVGSE